MERESPSPSVRPPLSAACAHDHGHHGGHHRPRPRPAAPKVPKSVAQLGEWLRPPSDWGWLGASGHRPTAAGTAASAGAALPARPPAAPAPHPPKCTICAAAVIDNKDKGFGILLQAVLVGVRWRVEGGPVAVGGSWMGGGWSLASLRLATPAGSGRPHCSSCWTCARWQYCHSPSPLPAEPCLHFISCRSCYLCH